MSKGMTSLHSHSGIERELKMPKHLVLVDEEYEDSIISDSIRESIKFKKIKYKQRTYLEVPIMMFVKNGGIFKNLNE